MIDELNKRLDQLRKAHGLSHAKFGEIAGVSAQAAHLWTKGGKITDEPLRKITDYFELDFVTFKYGNGTSEENSNSVLSGETNFLRRLEKLYKEYEKMPADKRDLIDEAIKQQAELRRLLDAKRNDEN